MFDNILFVILMAVITVVISFLVHRNITLSQKVKTLEGQVLIDPLTGALNKLGYGKELVRMFNDLPDSKDDRRRHLNHHTEVFALMIDADHFKKVNDTHGHVVGDQLLKELASLVSETVRTSDTFGRYGGEEFIVLSEDLDQAGFEALAEKIRNAVAGTLFTEKKISFTVSIGGASTEYSEDDGNSLLKRADAALYKAKESGRNRCVLD